MTYSIHGDMKKKLISITPSICDCNLELENYVCNILFLTIKLCTKKHTHIKNMTKLRKSTSDLIRYTMFNHQSQQLSSKLIEKADI